MPVKKLKEFLDLKKVRYVSIRHSPAFTAQEVAAAAHVPGKELAKTVMVKIDGEMAMAVLPAPKKLDVGRLKRASGAGKVSLAEENEFKSRFPECELGAMPPFGNLYEMNVFVDTTLREDESIVFNAGSHSELVRLSYADFERLVNPVAAELSA